MNNHYTFFAHLLSVVVKNPSQPGLEKYRIEDLKMNFFRAGYNIQDVNSVEVNIFQQVKGFMGIEDQDWVSLKYAYPI